MKILRYRFLHESIAVITLLVIAGCSGDPELNPAETSPDSRQYTWVVITDSYAPVRSEASPDASPATLLRENEVVEVINSKIETEQYLGTRGRWFHVRVPDAKDGWLFEGYFKGFYTLSQAEHYADGRAE